MENAKSLWQTVQNALTTADYSISPYNTYYKKLNLDVDTLMDALKISQRGPKVILKWNPQDVFINACNHDILSLWRGNVDLQYVINEIATVKYAFSYMTKGEKGMGETLKRVAKECQNDAIQTQMNNIKKEFLGKWVLGAPESTMWVLSMWLMKKRRKVVSVSTSMKDECISLPKPKSQLAQLHDDDEDVFATSLIDRYAARPLALQKTCLATFVVTYDVIQSSTKIEETEDINAGEEMQNTENDNSLTKIKLWKGLGVMRKRKHEGILHTRRYKIHAEPEKYYHSKLLLYYPWNHEDDIISTYTTYHDSYISKQDIIHQNAKKINEDCVAFDVDLQDLENNIPQSAREMVAPNIAQGDRTTNVQGFYTLQNEQQEQEDTIDAVSHDNTRTTRDTLCMLYAKVAKSQDMNFQDNCRHVCNLNTDKCHIVMYNRAWCKSYINEVRHGETKKDMEFF